MVQIARVFVFTLSVCATASACAQTEARAGRLTLAKTEAIALEHQPAMQAAQLRARAAEQRVREAHSGLLPMVTFNATGVRVADTGTSTAAGNITTSSISDRFAYGVNLSQLVTDFGRTHALVESSRANADAQGAMATLSRAQVRLNVRQAYYAVLGAEAVLRAAQAALDSRRLVARQLTALAQSELRSTLDVNFANVLASQAELAVVQAQSNVAEARNHLATAMGQAHPVSAALEDISATAEPLPPAPEELQHQAQTQRADLSAAKDESRAASQFAAAEKRLSLPTVNVLAAAGQVPFHDHTLHDNYAAAGFNLNIPVFNGGLFAARRSEAELEASARAQDEQQVSLAVNEQVNDAWLQADAAFRALDVTARLVAQSREALRLAQDRYDAGLGSVVELNEAQLNETSAEISAASALDTYLTRRAELDFAAGLLN